MYRANAQGVDGAGEICPQDGCARHVTAVAGIADQPGPAAPSRASNYCYRHRQLHPRFKKPYSWPDYPPAPCPCRQPLAMEGDQWGAPPPPRPRLAGSRGLLAAAAANAAGSPGAPVQPALRRPRMAQRQGTERHAGPRITCPCLPVLPTLPTHLPAPAAAAGAADVPPLAPRDPALPLPLPWSDYFDAQQQVHCPDRGATFNVYTAGVSRGWARLPAGVLAARHSVHALVCLRGMLWPPAWCALLHTKPAPTATACTCQGRVPIAGARSAGHVLELYVTHAGSSPPWEPPRPCPPLAPLAFPPPLRQQRPRGALPTRRRLHRPVLGPDSPQAERQVRRAWGGRRAPLPRKAPCSAAAGRCLSRADGPTCKGCALAREARIET